MSTPLFMLGRPGIFKFLLFLIIQVDATFDSKTKLICQMSELSCDGSFASKLNIACSNRRKHFRENASCAGDKLKVKSVQKSKSQKEKSKTERQFADCALRRAWNGVKTIIGTDKKRAEISVSDNLKFTTSVSHGSKYSENTDSATLDFLCFNGACPCKLGHYFSRGQNTCIKECSVFDKKMDSYKGAGIIGHNNKGVRKPNLKSCVMECVQEKAFTCVTAEYYHATGECYLSVYGYLDVDEEDKIYSPGWIFSQRQCK